jgi:hypothetical protein
MLRKRRSLYFHVAVDAWLMDQSLCLAAIVARTKLIAGEKDMMVE